MGRHPGVYSGGACALSLSIYENVTNLTFLQIVILQKVCQHLCLFADVCLRAIRRPRRLLRSKKKQKKQKKRNPVFLRRNQRHDNQDKWRMLRTYSRIFRP